jgi:hypothetical protein
MAFAGKSSRCVKLEVEEGDDYYRSLLVPILGSVLPF